MGAAKLAFGLACSTMLLVLLFLSAPAFAVEPVAPAIAEENVLSVGSSTALLGAQITPNGLPTAYHVEYVSEAQFQAHEWAEAARVPATDAELPGAAGPLPVSEELTGLQPETGYRFRFIAGFIAASPLKTVLGAEVKFTTVGSVAASALPDERAYELVSPAGEGESYLPPTAHGEGVEATGFRASLPFRAAADGDALAWVGEPAASVGTGETGPGEGNEWLSKRTAQGWQSSDITPTASREALYQAFSSDLNSAILESPFASLTDQTSGTCSSLYSRASESGALSPLLTTARCGSPLFAGASADESQIIFQETAALTPNAQEATEEPPGHAGSHAAPGERGSPCMFGCNLYELSGGQLSLVNVLPETEGKPGKTVPNATFGGYAGNESGYPEESKLTDFSHTISNDGSRIFWTDTQAGPDMEHVYVLENGTETVQVSGAGAAEYWTATPDGHYAYYTENGELWRFDTDSRERVALTPASYNGVGTGDVVGPGAGKGTTTAGSNLVTGVVTSSGAFAVGQTVSGVPGEGCGSGCIPEGATITAVGAETLTLSSNATESEDNFGITAGSDEVTSLVTTSGHFQRGEQIFGDGIPQGSKIISVTANTIRLSSFVTAAGTGEAIEAGGSEVQGVIGANETGEDGSYIYYVADGGITGATARSCVSFRERGARIESERTKGWISDELANEEFSEDHQEEAEEDAGRIPSKTGCNLYMRHGESTTLVATLAPQDNSIRAFAGGGLERTSDWVANVGNHIAQVTPDGRHLVFQSAWPQTGYDNRRGTNLQLEVYIYAADSGQLACGSCNPTGAPATIHEEEGASQLPESTEDADTFMRRLISENGNRVFFTTEQALVPQDTNGVQDVYEWEREGEGTCSPQTPARLNRGCVFLLSGGISKIDSFLIEVDAAGENVFFEHVGQLGQVQAPVDHNLVYDARVKGGFPTISQVCTGTGCQGVPPGPPIFATPASVTFSGLGNLSPVAPTKALTRPRKLAKALKACKKDKKKRKRDGCERKARRQYGAKKLRKHASKAKKASSERRTQS